MFKKIQVQRVFILLIIIIGTYYFFSNIKYLKSDSEKDSLKKIVNIYCNLEFNGKIQQKFIDEKQHNLKKVVINEQGTIKEFGLDFEELNLFNYLKVGDSISKNQNSLNLVVYRFNQDTIIRFEFKNFKNIENYPSPNCSYD